MSDSEIITYEELESTDVINVELVPERKGLIIKHCEYYVSSRRHGTTVTRRYNDFAQLYDILSAKYPYRAVCRLPPKCVVVGGGSEDFLARRRDALQRWLTLTARHPVLAHDADVRAFLCELQLKMERPKHDEFLLAGTTDSDHKDAVSTEEMEAAFVAEQEELRVMHLGLTRLSHVFDRASQRVASERADIRSLGAGLSALADVARPALAASAQLACGAEEEGGECEAGALEEALAALCAYRELRARLTRGLHAERAAAARASPAAAALRARHRYAHKAAAQEGAVARAYAAAGIDAAIGALERRGAAHARLAALWAALHRAATQRLIASGSSTKTH